MTLDEEAAEAARLGLSYGEYVGLRDSGYLEKYLESRKELTGNIIPSNILGSRGKIKNRQDRKLA